MNHSWRRSNGSMVIGILLLVVGIVLMMQNFNLFYVGSLWSYWPLGLTIIGIVKLVNAENKKQFGEGVWWIFIGAWLYVSIRHVYGLDFGDTWPALVIAAGVSIIWKSYTDQSLMSAGRHSSFVKE